MYKEYRNARVGQVNGGQGTGSANPDPPEGDPGVPTLVDMPWLRERVPGQGPELRVVDASWHMPAWKRSGLEEYKKEHIPGAVYFNISEVQDKSAKYGNQMLPSEEFFSEYVGRLGITRETHVIIYDNNADLGMFSAPRAWFIFRVFGHTKLSVLNGGLPAWKRQGGEVTTEVPGVEECRYEGKYRAGLVKSYYDIVSNLADRSFIYVDARPPPRFEGKAPEPMPGIKPGHIPDSVNLPFPQMLDSDTKTFKSPEKLADVFKLKRIKLNQPVVFSCGTGLTACFLSLGAYILGHRDIPLYDGAWAEWFQRADVEDMVGVPRPEEDEGKEQK